MVINNFCTLIQIFYIFLIERCTWCGTFGLSEQSDDCSTTGRSLSSPTTAAATTIQEWTGKFFTMIKIVLKVIDFCTQNRVPLNKK